MHLETDGRKEASIVVVKRDLGAFKSKKTVSAGIHSRRGKIQITVFRTLVL